MPLAPTRRLLSRVLVLLAVPSATAIACDEGSSAPSPPGVGGSGGSLAGAGAASGSGGSAGSGGAPWDGLPPVPPADGDHDPGFGYPDCGPAPAPNGMPANTGPCCVKIACREPSPSGVCPPAAGVRLGSGSGTCDCGETDGPYMATEAQKGESLDGKGCCYRARVMWCTGRPLLVAGLTRVAMRRVSVDWAS